MSIYIHTIKIVFDNVYIDGTVVLEYIILYKT